MQEFDDEINFTEYVLLLWKRKWLIIIPTIIVVIITGIYSFLSPKKWKIDMIIQPSMFLVDTGAGFSKVTTIAPRQLADQIKESSYNQLLARQLNINIREFPRLKAEHLTNTDLLLVSVRMKDVEKAKSVLNSLFNHVKIIYDKKIDTEIKGVDTEIATKENAIKQQELLLREKENQIKTKKNQIERIEDEIQLKDSEIQSKEIDKKNQIERLEDELQLKDSEIQSKEIDKDRIKREIESSQNKLKISEERVNDISEEMTVVKERINETEEQLKKALAESKQENMVISLLLYSNEIQQSLQYYSILGEKLSNEKITQENLYLLIRGNEKEIRQIDNQISQIKIMKNTIETRIDDINAQIDNQISQIKIMKNTIKTEIDDINTQIDMIKIEKEKISSNIEEIKSQNQFLEEKKGRYDYTLLIKNPTASNSPVSLGVKKSVLFAGLIGLFIFSLIAIFLENLKKFRSKA